MDNKALEETNAELKKEMTSLKERNHSLEQMLNELLAKGFLFALFDIILSFIYFLNKTYCY